jgi:hypothetical protein
MIRGALAAAFLLAPAVAASGAESASYINALHVFSSGGGAIGLAAPGGTGSYGMVASIGQPATGEIKDVANPDKTNVSFFAPVFFGSYYNLSLAAGYNLISIPLMPDKAYTAEALGQAINAQGGRCVTVISYKNEEGRFYSHPVGTAVENFPVEVGNGYFVRCMQPSKVKIEGFPFTRSKAEIELLEGYNLIGLPLSPSAPYQAEGAGSEINSQSAQSNAKQIIDYDSALGSFVTHPVGTAVNNFELKLGKGYFIRCMYNWTWQLSR